MNSTWRTGVKYEALHALPEVVELANCIAEMRVGSNKQREYAQLKLMWLTRPPPTRPLLYLLPFIRDLPRLTRDPI